MQSTSVASDMPSGEEASDPGKKVDMADLKRKSVRGGLVTMVSQACTITIQLISTVVIARILSPAEYGIVAMVTAVTSFAGLFRDLGLSAASIQKKNLTHQEQTNLFWLNLLMGLSLTFIVAAASPAVAWFYGRPELKQLTVALSLTFTIGALGTQHGASLVREMRFSRQAASNIAGSLVGLLVSVILAKNGFSYWSLVWGTLIAGITTTILLFTLSSFWPGRPTKFSEIRNLVRFGASLTLFDVINYFHRNLDNILIGRYWGAGALAYYARAYQLLMFPINAIRGPLNTVAFPALSRLQAEPAKFRKYYQNVTAIVAVLSMPLCAFLFMTSKDIIEVLLGEQWSEVPKIFSILAVVGFAQPSASLRGSVVIALGLGRRYIHLGLVQAGITSLGFLIGVKWGAIGVAYSYVISVYLALPILFRIAFKNTEMSIKDYLRAVARPAFASLSAMGLTFFLVQPMLSHLGVHLRLIIMGPAFGLFVLIILASLPGGRAFLEQLAGLLPSGKWKAKLLKN